MKIIALEIKNPKTSTESFSRYAKEEALRVHELWQDGFIREMYFRDDQDAAVLVIEDEDTESARNKLNRLPFVKHGLISFEVIPVKPYPGFERLFTKSV